MDWYNDELKLEETELATFEQKWLCPTAECAGNMMYNGASWCSNPQGYHHQCSKCGTLLATSEGMFPRTVHRAKVKTE